MGAAGVCSTPLPWPGMASRGRPRGWPGARRSPGTGRTRRRGPGGPSRSGPPTGRRGRRRRPRCGSVWADTVSVTPTTRVACRRGRGRPELLLVRDRSRGVSRDTTSSGHSDQAGGRPPSTAGDLRRRPRAGPRTPRRVQPATSAGPGPPRPGPAATRSEDTPGPPSAATAPRPREPPTATSAATPAARTRPPWRPGSGPGSGPVPTRGAWAGAPRGGRRRSPGDAEAPATRTGQPDEAHEEEGSAEPGRPARGLAAWPRAIPPRGRPPKGQLERSASPRTMAPASTAVRPRPGGDHGAGQAGPGLRGA